MCHYNWELAGQPCFGD